MIQLARREDCEAMGRGSVAVAPVSARSRAMGHLRVVDAPKFSALPHEILFDTRLSHGAIVLYAVLQSHWWQGGECHASNAILVNEVRCSDSQLRRYFAELLAHKHIAARRRGQGQAKAYRPTKPLPGDGKAYSQPLTDERFNRSETDGSAFNRSPVTIQPFTGDAFNRSPVTDPYKKTPEDSLKEEDTIASVAAVAAPAPDEVKPKRESRASRLTDDAELTERHLRAAGDVGFDSARAGAEWPKFTDYHRAKGSRMVDWLAAWRTWLRNAVEFDVRRNGRSGAPTRQSPNGTGRPSQPSKLPAKNVRTYEIRSKPDV